MFRLLAPALVIAVAAAAHAQSAPASGMLIGTSEVAALATDPSVVILHVVDGRGATFEDAHIPGARPVRYLDFAVDGPDSAGTELPPAEDVKRIFEAAGVSNTSRVIVYGSSAVTAARAFFTLDAMGHPRVAVLDGGLRTWRAEGRPVETGPAKATAKGQFTPKVNADRVATAQLIRQAMPANAIALVDVRPDPEFLGTDGGLGGMHAAGHIEGAKQLTWNSLVDGDGRFLPRDQLQARLTGAGAVTSKPVVAYCMVGMRASVVYFVARHLGYDVKLYDGSIVDWTQRKLPVKTGRQ